MTKLGRWRTLQCLPGVREGQEDMTIKGQNNEGAPWWGQNGSYLDCACGYMNLYS